MSQFENLFRISADGGIELNKPELRQYSMFKSFVGDKKDNLQDMMFIYLMGDPRSMYSHLTGEEKLERVKKHIGRDSAWAPTPKLRGAVAEYEDLVGLTPTGKAFLAANKSLYESGNDINDLVNNTAYLKRLLKTKIDVLESDTMGLDETVILIKECKGLMKEIISNQKEVNRLIAALPDVFKTVETLAKNWANEGNGTREIYGGGELNNRE